MPVLIDMQSMTMTDDRDFLQKLTREILVAVDDPELSKKVLQAAAPDNPFTAFEDLVRDIGGKLGGRRLILMFDEYELFETHIDKGRFTTDILHLFATWMEHECWNIKNTHP